MAWLAVNKNGQEMIFPNKPIRYRNEWSDEHDIFIEGEYGIVEMEIKLPSGTIEKIIGRPLTWNDEPVEIKNMEDITIKGVTFKYLDEWKFSLPRYSLIIPVFYRKKIKKLLITNGETRESFYVNTNTYNIYLPAECNLFYTPHGSSIQVITPVDILVVSTQISIYPQNI